MNKQLLNIAKEASCEIESRGDLERRYSDSEDFIEVAVWSIEEMLEKAYELGKKNAKATQAKKVGQATEPKSKAENNGIKIAWVDGNWHVGTIDGIKFEAKVYEENSEDYGINGGNVSKLWVDGYLNYDRGWDMRARTKKAKELLARLLDYFKVEG